MVTQGNRARGGVYLPLPYIGPKGQIEIYFSPKFELLKKIPFVEHSNISSFTISINKTKSIRENIEGLCVLKKPFN